MNSEFHSLVKQLGDEDKETKREKKWRRRSKDFFLLFSLSRGDTKIFRRRDQSSRSEKEMGVGFYRVGKMFIRSETKIFFL